ncbi:MAG: Gfo/Idh/MocA family oxidoreductase [Lentisphaeria bacterium]|nr:Gfo/Idh/MocA family oxidoreductase [Lentisphaeria bacterium]
MAKKLGFGVLGAGLVAPFHAKGIVNSDGGDLIAFCDIDQERVGKLADEYGVKGYTSLEEMLEDPAVDVVNVALPNHLHYNAVIKCAAAGKHVLTEKPPAMTLRETDAMIAACREAGVKFGCTVQCRVRKSIQAIKQAIDTGRFGKLLHADAYMKWFRPTEYYQSDAWRSLRKAGAGVTVQHAFHYIDLLQHLVGPAARVEAKMTNLAHPGVALEDTLIGYIEFANGAHGIIEASTALWPGTDVRIEINGTKGTAIMVGERMTTWQFQDECPEDEEIRAYGDVSQTTGAGGAADFGFADHMVVIQDLIDAVDEGRDVVIPVKSVRPTLEIVLGMYQSDSRGAPVELPLEDDPSIWE